MKKKHPWLFKGVAVVMALALAAGIIAMGIPAAT